MTLPSDFQNGAAEMMDTFDPNAKPYPDLRPLEEERTAEVTLRGGGENTDAEAAIKYAYSQPIAQLSKLTQKLYGFIRDAALEKGLPQTALMGAMALTDLVLNAPCNNRQGRWDEEEARAKRWEDLIAKDERDEDEDEVEVRPKVAVLLGHWSEADAFMGHARIVEEQEGIEAARPLYAEFKEMRAQVAEVQREAVRLRPPEYQLFLCRVRQYQISRERAYDLAMGNPIADFTEVKRKLAAGADVHELVHELPWPFQELYRLCMASLADGTAHRELLAALMGQHPLNRSQATPPWGMPAAYYPGMWPNGDEDAEDTSGQGKRRAIFGFNFGKNGTQKNEEEQPMRRRTRRAA